MAEGGNVGRLHVRVDGDTRGLEAAARRTRRSLGRMRKDTADTARRTAASFSGMAAAILPAVTAVAGLTAAFTAFRSTMARITELENFSQITGISIQRLEALEDVAQRTGVSIDIMRRAAEQFGRRMAGELLSETSRGSRAIKALGIDVRDASGNIRNFEEVLLDAAEKLSEYVGVNNKAALAAALFGEEVGPKLIPVLNRGRAALEGLFRATRQTFTAEDLRRAQAYRNATADLSDAWQKLNRELFRTGGLGNEVIRRLEAIVRLGTLLASAPNAIQEAGDALDAARQQAENYKKQIEGVKKELEKLEGTGFTEQIDRQEAALGRANERLAAQKRLIRELGAEFSRLLLGGGDEDTRPTAPGLGDDDAAGAAAAATARAQAAVEQWLAAASGQRTMLESLNASWQTHGDIVAGAVERITKAQQDGVQREIQIARVKRQLNVQFEQQAIGVARNVASSIEQLWPKQKAAAIANALINTAVGVTEAIKLPFPLNWAQVAAVGAAGAAQIAAIRSTNLSGTGGGTASTGGSSSPQQPIEPAPQPRQTAIRLEATDPAGLFTWRTIERLAEQLNEHTKNGGVLISTRNLPI